MTMPHEEVRSLKQTREFLRSILPMRLCDFRKMKKADFDKWKEGLHSCLRHYPWDTTIDRRWGDETEETKGGLNEMRQQ